MGSVFKGYEEFVVQDLVLEPRVILYRRERWLTPDGRSLVAPLPAEVVPGSHFGPDLICFILHQYHHQHVTQPLLLEQLHQLGIDISAGELNRILTEGKDAFHQEKAELLPAALAVSRLRPGGRHRGAAPGAQWGLHPDRQRALRFLRQHREQEPAQLPGDPPGAAHRLRDQ